MIVAHIDSPVTDHFGRSELVRLGDPPAAVAKPASSDVAAVLDDPRPGGLLRDGGWTPARSSAGRTRPDPTAARTGGCARSAVERSACTYRQWQLRVLDPGLLDAQDRRPRPWLMKPPDQDVVDAEFQESTGRALADGGDSPIVCEESRRVLHQSRRATTLAQETASAPHGTQLSDSFDDSGQALTASDTHRLQPVPRLSTVHLVDQRGQDSPTGRPDRVAEGDP